LAIQILTMGSATSRDETMRSEIKDFDNKHKDMFKKIEHALHDERRLTGKERSAMDEKVNSFVRKSLLGREEQFSDALGKVLKIARGDKETRDAQYRSIVTEWVSIVHKHDMEISSGPRDGLIREMEVVYAKDKQISDFTYEKEVTAELENAMYEDKLQRDNLYKELLVHLADCIKHANQDMYRKHSSTTYRLENELTIKDKEFQISNSIEVRQKFDSILQNPTKSGLDLAKQKGKVADIVREDKAGVDKKRQQYGNALSGVVQSDQKWVDQQTSQLLERLIKLVNTFKAQITSLNKGIGTQVCRIIWAGENCLYQRYRAMKYSLFDVLRSQVDLGERRKTDLVTALGEYRKLFKAANEGVLSTQHSEVLVACNKVFLEDDERVTDTHTTHLSAELTAMVNEEKAHMDAKRRAVLHQLEELIKRDQELSDEKVRAMIVKIETLYAPFDAEEPAASAKKA
jgi:hypothetical protein